MKASFDTEGLDSHVRSHVEADLFSGAILIAKDSEPIFKGAYGLASKRYNVPNRVDTKFNIGSLNKMFTSVAVAQLAERGELSYDVPIIDYPSDYPPEVANKVTVRHLLTFTSGLGHYWNERFKASIGGLRSVDDFVRLFVDDPLSFEPGEGNQYSNSGYVLLGKIIEEVSGQDYYEYIRERVYGPAGMGDTDHYELDAPVPNLATGYTRMGVDGRPTEGPWRNNTFLIGVKGSPAGGGYSTVEDLFRFDTSMQSHKLVAPEYLIPIGPPRKTEGEQKPRVITRAGGAQGVAALYERYPDLGYTVMVLSNYDPVDVHRRRIVSVGDKIREMITGDTR